MGVTASATETDNLGASFVVGGLVVLPHELEDAVMAAGLHVVTLFVELLLTGEGIDELLATPLDVMGDNRKYGAGDGLREILACLPGDGGVGVLDQLARNERMVAWDERGCVLGAKLCS